MRTLAPSRAAGAARRAHFFISSLFMHSSSIQVLLPTNCPSYDFSFLALLLPRGETERLLQSIKHILIHLSNLAAGPHGHSLWPQYRSFTVVQASLASIETQPFIHPLVCTCCPWDPRDGPCSTPPCSQWYSYRSPLLWPETLGGHGSSSTRYLWIHGTTVFCGDRP